MTSWIIDPTGNRSTGSLPVSDRGFRYGMSVFETIACSGERLLFLFDHLDRLKRAAAAAGILFPAHLAAERLSELLVEIPDVPGVLRLYLTAGDGGPLDPVIEPRAFAHFEHTHFPTAAEIADGYSLHLSAVPFPIILGGWKTANYWPNIQALAEAKHHGCHESLVFNSTGALISASMANVFFVLDGRVVTPARECGARDGVVRAWIKEQTPVEEAFLIIDDIASAEECFLTNSRLGVMPVTAIDGRKLPSRVQADQLAALYRRTIFAG